MDNFKNNFLFINSNLIYIFLNERKTSAVNLFLALQKTKKKTIKNF